MNGWIKLHRELIDKPIWQNSTLEQRIILITLLCMANHKQKKWEFNGELYEIQAGQFITSLPGIVEKCASKEITVQKVRTALDRFEKLGFLTGKSTNKNRLITIVNWNIYQGFEDEHNKRDNSQVTDNQQADNRQLTANNNVNNINNNNNDDNIYQSIYQNTPAPTPLSNTQGIDMDFIDLLREKINYDDMCLIHETSDVDNIIDLAFDLIATTKGVIHIGEKTYPRDYVKQKLLTLDYGKVDFLIGKSKEIGLNADIRNPKRYMQSCILSTALNYNVEFQEYFNRTFYGGDE